MVFWRLVATAALTVYSLCVLPLALQDRVEASESPCPACGGRGYEPCHCTRWSDNDVGCGTCSRTGYMRCRSCGGGGTAVPIKVAIRK